MINIKSLFKTDLAIGDTVTVIGNSNGNNYIIGQEYKVSVVHGNGAYTLSLPGSPHFLGNMVVLADLKYNIDNIDKDSIILELANLVEFIKDCDDISDLSKLEKEFKVFTILKEIKSSRSDFEKINIISKYI